MTSGCTPATAVDDDPRHRRAGPGRARAPASTRSSAEAPSLIPELLPAVTDPPGPERRPERGERLGRGVRARMLVAVHDGHGALAARHRDRHQLAREPPALDGRAAHAAGSRARTRPGARARPRTGPRRTRPSRPARSAGRACCIRGLTNRQPSVVSSIVRGPAVVGGLRLEHHVRGPRHGLDAAGDEHVAVARADRMARRVDRLEPGAAQPVDGLAARPRRAGRRAARPSGRRCGCPRPPGWRSRGSRPRSGARRSRSGRRAARMTIGGQVVGPDRGERAAVAPDRACARRR